MLRLSACGADVFSRAVLRLEAYFLGWALSATVVVLSFVACRKLFDGGYSWTYTIRMLARHQSMFFFSRGDISRFVVDRGAYVVLLAFRRPRICILAFTAYSGVCDGGALRRVSVGVRTTCLRCVLRDCCLVSDCVFLPNESGAFQLKSTAFKLPLFLAVLRGSHTVCFFEYFTEIQLVADANRLGYLQYGCVCLSKQIGCK